MRNLALVVQYDGTDFHGFASQREVRTVQGELTKCLNRLLAENIRLYGAGRTDAGVHAKGQVVNFITETRIPADRMAIALNRILPKDIAILSAKEKPLDWSARFTAYSRFYEYTVLTKGRPTPFKTRYALYHPKYLDAELMNTAAQYLIGEHDFGAFTLEPPNSRHFIRKIFNASVKQTAEYIKFNIEGTAFLQGMIRLIMGVLIDVGHHKAEPKIIDNYLNETQGKRATLVIPPCGLCLKKVRYRL